MIIGIDGSRAEGEQKTGIERYCFEIIARLIKNKKHHFILWSRAPIENNFSSGNNVVWKAIPLPFLWSQLRLSLELWQTKTDLVFIPGHVIPLFGKGKFVVTIHDLAFEYYPEVYSKIQLWYQRLAVRTAIKKSTAIIVPSASTKKDLIKFYLVDKDKIQVVSHGVDHRKYYPPKLSNKDYLGFGIKIPYILFTGRLELKKNLINLIKGYAMLRQESQIKHQLVLVGQPALGYQKIRREIEQLPPNFQKDIIETGYVADKTFQAIIRQSDILIVPSLHEGFGLPVLEAMACAVPVLASGSSALAEIIFDKNLLFDGRKPFSLAAKLSWLIHHPSEYRKIQMREIDYAKKFTWEKSAQQTLEILEETTK